MKYEDVLKRFVSSQAQLLQEKQMKQQLQEKMLEAQSQGLRSFVPGMQGHSPEEEYTETEHNPFEEGQEFKAGGINIDPKKKGTFKAQATRMGMSIQEAASHILNNKEKYTSTMVKKANFAKNFAKEEGGMYTGDYEYPEGGTTNDPNISVGVNAFPEMGASISPSVNFQKGNFRANVSTQIPVEHPKSYDGNFNVNADYNAGKYGDIGFTAASYKGLEGRPTYSAGANYEVPLTDKLNLMANLRANSLKDLKNSEASLGLRYSFENGGDTPDVLMKEFMKTAEFKKGLDRMMSNSKKDNTDSFLEAMTEANYPQELYDKYHNMMSSDAWQKAIPYQSQYQKRGKMGEYQDMMNQLEGSQRYNTPYGKFAEGPSSVLARDMRTDKEVNEDAKREFLLNAISSGLKPRTPYDDGRVDPRTLEAIQPSAEEMKKGGEMIRRADGSYSQRGMWDNIRDNRGSGKKPTKEMLEQERKIRREFATGGSFNNPGFNALPEAVQDKIIAAMMYGGYIGNNNWH